MNKIDIKKIPKTDIKDGLMIMYDKETDIETRFAFADIKKGERYYNFPPVSLRKAERIYIHLTDL